MSNQSDFGDHQKFQLSVFSIKDKINKLSNNLQKYDAQVKHVRENLPQSVISETIQEDGGELVRSYIITATGHISQMSIMRDDDESEMSRYHNVK